MRPSALVERYRMALEVIAAGSAWEPGTGIAKIALSDPWGLQTVDMARFERAVAEDKGRLSVNEAVEKAREAEPEPEPEDDEPEPVDLAEEIAEAAEEVAAAPVGEHQEVKRNGGGSDEGRLLESVNFKPGWSIAQHASRLDLHANKVSLAMRKLEDEGEVRGEPRNGRVVWVTR